MGDLSIGSTLAGYRLDALIARGGMGVVYRATQLSLERPVALKVIARHLASNEDFRDRFLRESRLAARLDHPAVVPVYDAREEDGELLVAMRLVEGGDLKKRIAESGPLPPQQAVDLLGQVAGALDAAHAAGIVHRDVKPHNVLLEGPRRAYLTDFGLAKALGDSGALSGTSIVGTVEYMSPEQWRGEKVGPAADIYSLGCVLYECVTGVVPYARGADDEPPQMPAGLDAVIERAVAADPARRFPSAGAMIEAARERQEATPTATRVLSQPPERATARLGARRGGVRERLTGLRRGWLAIAGLVAVALFAGILILSAGGGVSVSAPLHVGHAPLRLAAGRDAVWVTSGVDGTLTRVDPGSAQVVGRALHVGQGVSGVTVGAGSVWVSSPADGSVLKIDPASGSVVDRIAVDGTPGAIVFGGGRVWVADDSGSGVTAINAAGDRVIKRRIPPHAAPLRLAVGAGAVWASSASTGAVRRIDLGTATAGAPVPVGRGPAGVTVGGGLVWVANSRSGTVSRVDPSIHALVGDPIPIDGRPGGVDAGTTVVWVANVSDGSLVRLSLETGEQVGGAIAVGPEPGAVAVGGEAVWVANNGDGTITRVEP